MTPTSTGRRRRSTCATLPRGAHLEGSRQGGRGGASTRRAREVRVGALVDAYCTIPTSGSQTVNRVTQSCREVIKSREIQQQLKEEERRREQEKDIMQQRILARKAREEYAREQVLVCVALCWLVLQVVAHSLVVGKPLSGARSTCSRGCCSQPR